MPDMTALEAHLRGLYESFGLQACQDLQELEAGGSYAALLRALSGTGCTDRLSTARELADCCYGLLQARGLLPPILSWGVSAPPTKDNTCQLPASHSSACCPCNGRKLKAQCHAFAAICYGLLPPKGWLPCAKLPVFRRLPASMSSGLLQAHGWAHPAFREAYVLAQLSAAVELCACCSTAAQGLRESDSTSDCLGGAAARELRSAGGGAGNSPRTRSARAAAAGEVALLACRGASGACSCGPARQPGAGASQHAAAVAAACQREHGTPAAGGEPRALALDALRAVDMALILGAPPEAAAPVRLRGPIFHGALLAMCQRLCWLGSHRVALHALRTTVLPLACVLERARGWNVCRPDRGLPVATRVRLILNEQIKHHVLQR